jgi:hypothetical protein
MTDRHSVPSLGLKHFLFTLNCPQVNGSDHTVAVMLVVLLVITAIFAGALATGLAAYYKNRGRFHGGSRIRGDEETATELSAPFLFERPSRWLAIKCSKLEKVQAALGLHNPTPCPLSEGFSGLADRKLFISPPIKGWILVVGNSLPDPAGDIDKLYHFLMRAANELGSVQFFCANRAVNHHAWVRIENNRVYRAYAWAGETLWNQGERTAAERELGLRCYAYGDIPMPFPFSARDSHIANAEKVMQLAARWSVDPLAVNNHALRAALGITGDLSRRS